MRRKGYHVPKVHATPQPSNPRTPQHKPAHQLHRPHAPHRSHPRTLHHHKRLRTHVHRTHHEPRRRDLVPHQNLRVPRVETDQPQTSACHHELTLRHAHPPHRVNQLRQHVPPHNRFRIRQRPPDEHALPALRVPHLECATRDPREQAHPPPPRSREPHQDPVVHHEPRHGAPRLALPMHVDSVHVDIPVEPGEGDVGVADNDSRHRARVGPEEWAVVGEVGADVVVGFEVEDPHGSVYEAARQAGVGKREAAADQAPAMLRGIEARSQKRQPSSLEVGSRPMPVDVVAVPRVPHPERPSPDAPREVLPQQIRARHLPPRGTNLHAQCRKFSIMITHHCQPNSE